MRACVAQKGAIQGRDKDAVPGVGVRAPGSEGGEVVGGPEDLVGSGCELETEPAEVQPFQVMAAGTVDGVVEIESVDECGHAHTKIQKVECPWTVAHGRRQDEPGGMKHYQYSATSRAGKRVV